MNNSRTNFAPNCNMIIIINGGLFTCWGSIGLVFLVLAMFHEGALIAALLIKSPN